MRAPLDLRGKTGTVKRSDFTLYDVVGMPAALSAGKKAGRGKTPDLACRRKDCQNWRSQGNLLKGICKSLRPRSAITTKNVNERSAAKEGVKKFVPSTKIDFKPSPAWDGTGTSAR